MRRTLDGPIQFSPEVLARSAQLDDHVNLPERTYRALDAVDRMPPGLRQCVHEFGFAIVHALRSNGISNPSQIRQLVHEIWKGARQPQQGSCIRGPRHRERRSPVMEELDWVLLQAGAQISADCLLRLLYQNSFAVIPLEPTKQMIEASMATVSDGAVRCTKETKHKLRLRSALKAAIAHIWPQLLGDNR